MDGPLVDAIAWSSAASRFSALLQPAPVSQQPGPAVPEKDQKEPPKEQPAPPKEEPKAEKPPAPAAPERAPKKVPRSEEVAPQPQPPQPDAGSEGKGKELLGRACSQCHVVGAVENTRYTSKEAYASLIAKQRQMGAGLTDDEAKVLVDYLFNTYGVTQH